MPRWKSRLNPLHNILFGSRTRGNDSPFKGLCHIIWRTAPRPNLCAAPGKRGIPSTVMDGCEAGILTTPQHGESTSLPKSDERIKRRVGPLLGKRSP